MSVSPIFSALGDPVRAVIVERLVQSGPSSVSRLSQGLPITRQAVAKHLRVLTDAGVVTSSKSGREQVVSLEAAKLSEASAWLNQLASEWDVRLGRLKALLESD